MIRNLSVKTKLKMYFFGLAFFIFLVSSSAIFSISKIQNSAQDLYVHPYQVSVGSTETESEIRHMYSVMQNMVNSVDQNLISVQADLIEEIELEIEENIEIFYEYYLGDITSVTELEEEYLESKAIRSIVTDYLKNDDFVSAKEFMVTNGPSQQESLLEKLHVIQLFASNKADALNETALLQASLYTYLIIGFSTVVIAISIALVVYIIKDLVPPLEKLLKTIESHKNDENQSFLDLERQDELGIIGNSFNEMLSFMKTKEVMKNLDLKLSKLKSTEELYKTQLLLNASLESPKDIIILSLDTEYRYMFFNEAHSTSMKAAYNADVTNGACIFDFMTSKDDIKKIKENYDRALSGETLTTREQYGDIEKSYFEIILSPIFNNEKEIIGISSFSRDITEMTKANIKQKESEEKYKLLNDMMPLGLVHYQIVFDEVNKKNRYQFLEVNKVFEKLIGMKNSELVGKNLLDVFPKTEQYWLDNFDEVISTGNPITFEDFSVEVDGYMKVSVYIIKSDILAVVIEDITDFRRKQNEILHVSYHDSLTDLHNRRYYADNLSKLDIPENYPLTIVMSDINGLKLINDAFGHESGDKLLVEAANVITKSCRKTDLVARIGGDEFVIVMPNTSGVEAEKTIKKISENAKGITIESIELSISFGYATKVNKEQDIEETYRSAEDLMYRVKLLEIPSMRGGAIDTILNTLHEKDKSSEIHSRTVSEISGKIAKAYGMDTQEVNEVKTAGILHDIGKIIIPISIITKQGKLTHEEYNLIKGHPEIGFRILNSTHDLRIISNIVLCHHERWDGLGYPRGIKAEEIPLQSRIISIADAFDAMTSERTYRNIFTRKEAFDEIVDNAGTQFDPELVEVFKLHFNEIIVEI